MSSDAKARRTLLFKAIDHADQDLLALVLKNIIKAVPEAAKLAEPYLLVSKKSELESGTEGEEEPDRRPKKQKRDVDHVPEFVQRYRLCQNCEERYDVSKNGDDKCVFHPGTAEEDEEFFEQFDEYEGDDFEHSIEDWPEGFKWTCCDQISTKEGCVIQEHESLPTH